MSALRTTHPVPARGEHELVDAARGGSDGAFEELYSRYRWRIGAYVLGMVGDHGRAEDIVQEVFISALRRLRTSAQPIAFKPWIYQIAKNACIDESRRAGRVQEVPLELDGDADRRALHSLAPAPDVALERKQGLDDLRGAFRSLSERHHRVIVLRELEGRSYDEIGERMGVSKPVVESMLFRARRRLGEEYDELASGRRCEQIQAVVAADGERSVRALRTRERRQLARHLAHCQPCRRQARLAGLDDSCFQTPSVIGKIAALLPFPWLRIRLDPTGNDAVATPGSQPFVVSRALQSVARYADPSAPVLGLGHAAAAAAVIAVAGVGGGFATGLVGHGGGGGGGGHAAPGHEGRAGGLGAAGRGGAAGGHGAGATAGHAAGGPNGSAGGARRRGSRIAATSAPGTSTRVSSTGARVTRAGGLASAGSGSTGSGSGATSSVTGGSGGGPPAPGARLGAPLGRSATSGLPGVTLPGIKLSAPSIPGIQLPGIALPGVQSSLPGLPLVPNVQLPGVQLPGLQLPGVKLPGTSL